VKKPHLSEPRYIARVEIYIYTMKCIIYFLYLFPLSELTTKLNSLTCYRSKEKEEKQRDKEKEKPRERERKEPLIPRREVGGGPSVPPPRVPFQQGYSRHDFGPGSNNSPHTRPEPPLPGENRWSNIPQGRDR
jgi:hypothetical protein